MTEQRRQRCSRTELWNQTRKNKQLGETKGKGVSSLNQNLNKKVSIEEKKHICTHVGCTAYKVAMRTRRNCCHIYKQREERKASQSEKHRKNAQKRSSIQREQQKTQSRYRDSFNYDKTSEETGEEQQQRVKQQEQRESRKHKNEGSVNTQRAPLIKHVRPRRRAEN